MNSMALDLTSESFHSPSASVLHFSSSDVYDLTEPTKPQSSIIDDEDDDSDLIQETQQTIDNDLVSPSLLLSLDEYTNHRVTRLPRPDLQDGDLNLSSADSDVDEHATRAEQESEATRGLPVLTVNPMVSSDSGSPSNNIVVVPAPQPPVVNCGGLQLTQQDIEQIQHQLQQRLLNQPMTPAPPVHINFPPQQYVILGTVNPNLQSQFILPPAPTVPTSQTYSLSDLTAGQVQTPGLQQINNHLLSSSASTLISDTVSLSSSKPTSTLTKAPLTAPPPTFVKLHHKPEDTAQLEELQNFAKHFKQRRVELGYTQGDVGAALGLRFPNDFSQTTISRFEASNLSAPNMRKLMPLLQRWLDDQEQRQAKLVSDTFGNRSSPEPTSDAKRRKKRTTIEDRAKDLLEMYFCSNPKPNASDLTKIAQEHNIERDVVRVWFCNRRQREKKCGVKYSAIRPVVIQQNPLYTPINVIRTPLGHSQNSGSQTHPTNDVNTQQIIQVKQTETKRFEANAAALSAAMESPQGATIRGYVKPIIFNNG